MKRSGHRACAELKITFNGRMLHRVIPRMTLIKFRSKKRSIKLYKLLGTSNFFVYMSHDVYLNFSCTHCSCNLSRLFFLCRCIKSVRKIHFHSRKGSMLTSLCAPPSFESTKHIIVTTRRMWFTLFSLSFLFLSVVRVSVYLFRHGNGTPYKTKKHTT